MKAFIPICALLLFIAIADLPIGFYTFLRIAITTCCILVIFNDYRKGFSFWILLFGLIAILFNPLIPIYLYDKGVWIPIDIICGIVFLVKLFFIKELNENKDNAN